MMFLDPSYPLRGAKAVGIRPLIRSYLNGVVSALGISNPSSVVADLLAILTLTDSLDSAENVCKTRLGMEICSGLPDELAARRAKLYATQIAQWVRGDKILDLGCGNGLIGKILEWDYGCGVTFADTLDYLKVKKPLVIIDNGPLPFPDRSFDDALLITALHHMRDPLGGLSEAARVARKRLIIKESVIPVKNFQNVSRNGLTCQFVQLNYEHQLLYTCFIDWFYNRVLETGVDLPLGFRSTQQWIETLGRFGDVEAVMDLGIDDHLGALYHVLIVVDLSPKH